jgi:hypothetical protein
MLLEMAFIQVPQIYVLSFCQITAFFLKPPVWPDQHEQSKDGAFSSEIQTDERVFGIAEHPMAPYAIPQRDATKVSRPTCFENTQNIAAICVARY